MKKVRLSDYANSQSVCYLTAYKWFHSGIIKGEQLPTGTIYIFIDDQSDQSIIQQSNSVSLYARVSSSQQKDDLDRQLTRLTDYANSKGYKIIHSVKEVASGLNDNRQKLNQLLEKDDYSILIIEHKDRLTRFGFNYLKRLIENKNQKIEIMNETNPDKIDLMKDFVSIVTSFCARVYGQRRNKQKTKQLLEELKSDAKT